MPDKRINALTQSLAVSSLDYLVQDGSVGTRKNTIGNLFKNGTTVKYTLDGATIYPELDSALKAFYDSKYGSTNFISGTDYLSPSGNGSGLTGLIKSQVGLSNVDNTSDANKPISTAAQTALNLKVDNSGDFSGRFVETLTAGEALSLGDICYLKTDGKYWKAKADSALTSTTQLRMALSAISANSTGIFLAYGAYSTTGLTIGLKILSDTAYGAFTGTAVSGTDHISRIVGNAISSTVFFFNPDSSYITLA